MAKTTQLTTAQHEAATTLDRSLGIIAGAGTGKTRVLVERCHMLLQHTDINLNNLLVITFTERAAQELKHRLLQILPAHEHARLHGAAISTFHGFCMRILREHAPLLGLRNDFQLLDAESAHRDAQAIIRRTTLTLLDSGDAALLALLRNMNFSQIIQRIHKLIDDRWNVQRWHQTQNTQSPFLDVHASADERTVLDHIDHVFAHCVTALRQHRLDQQQLDFHDLEIFALELLAQHETILHDYQRQFVHILVDEFQDTNFLQMELVKLLFTPPDNHLCIVGDPKQSIYRFRGAQADCFAQMLQHIAEAGGTVINLRENFRSAPEVINFVNTCCTSIPVEQQLVAAGEHVSGQVTWLALPATQSADERRASEAQHVAQHIAELVARGEAQYGDIACLFATHAAISTFDHALRSCNIPTHVYSGGGFFAQQAIRDLLIVLQAVQELHTHGVCHDATLLTAIQTPCFGYSADECYQLRHASITDEAPTSFFAQLPADNPVRRTLERLACLAPHSTVEELIAQLLVDTDYFAVMQQLDPSGQSTANIEKFLMMAQAPHLSHNGLRDFITVMTEQSEREARMAEQPVTLAGDNAVQLLTVHASKGNEFPLVYLADLASKRAHRVESWNFIAGVGLGVRFPQQEESDYYAALRQYDREAEQAEYDRLLYVALTRAQRQLILPLQQHDKKPSATMLSWEPAIREALATQDIVATTITPSAVRAVNPHHAAHVHIGKRFTQLAPAHTQYFTVTELETYARCPQEFYLKYVLGEPARSMEWPTVSGLPPERRGELVHAVIHRRHQHALTWHDALDTELQRTRWPIDQQQREQLHQQFAHVSIPEHTRLLSEHPFRLQLDLADSQRAIITGTIDCMVQRPDGWLIIDYKTDTIDSHAAAQRQMDKYRLQLATYAFAAHHAGFQPLCGAQLQFLAGGYIVDLPTDAESIAHVETDLRRLIAHINAGQFDLDTQSRPPCRSCPYLHNGRCTQTPLEIERADTLLELGESPGEQQGV